MRKPTVRLFEAATILLSVARAQETPNPTGRATSSSPPFSSILFSQSVEGDTPFPVPFMCSVHQFQGDSLVGSRNTGWYGAFTPVHAPFVGVPYPWSACRMARPENERTVTS